MPALILHLSEAETEKLRYERYAYADPLVQKRIHAVYLKAILNWSNTLIGQVVGLHYNCVGQWINVYKAQGLAGLLTNHYAGRKSEMENHSESILQSFQNQPPLSAAQAAERIGEMSGLQRSTQQVRAFMKRHGLKFIKCGHVPSKADNEAQHQWWEQHSNPL